MKILAFADTHGNKAALGRVIKKAEQADILVCAGDITNWGEKLEELVENIEKTKKPLIIIPGNHETAEQIQSISKKFKFVIPLHKGSYELNKYLFFGYGGGGFSKEEPELARIIHKFKETIKKDSKIILITHAPPQNTKLDFLIYTGHVGCKTVTDFIKEIKPILAISGHLHENFKKIDTINGTKLINPGPDGKIIEI